MKVKGQLIPAPIIPGVHKLLNEDYKSKHVRFCWPFCLSVLLSLALEHKRTTDKLSRNNAKLYKVNKSGLVAVYSMGYMCSAIRIIQD